MTIVCKKKITVTTLEFVLASETKEKEVEDKGFELIGNIDYNSDDYNNIVNNNGGNLSLNKLFYKRVNLSLTRRLLSLEVSSFLQDIRSKYTLKGPKKAFQVSGPFQIPNDQTSFFYIGHYTSGKEKAIQLGNAISCCQNGFILFPCTFSSNVDVEKTPYLQSLFTPVQDDNLGTVNFYANLGRYIFNSISHRTDFTKFVDPACGQFYTSYGSLSYDTAQLNTTKKKQLKSGIMEQSNHIFDDDCMDLNTTYSKALSGLKPIKSGRGRKPKKNDDNDCLLDPSQKLATENSKKRNDQLKKLFDESPFFVKMLYSEFLLKKESYTYSYDDITTFYDQSPK